MGVMQLSEALAKKLEDFFDEKGTLKAILGDVEKINTKMAAEFGPAIASMAGIDIKALAAKVESTKAAQDGLVTSIKNSKRGLYVPGLEDKKFSVPMAILGYKTGGTKESFEKIGAGSEFEVLKAVFEKHGAQYGLKAGHALGDDKLGAYLIPDQVMADIIGPIYTQSVFVNLTGEDGDTNRVTMIDGISSAGNVKIPQFDGGMIAYWLDEDDSFVESQIKTGDVEMEPRKMGVLARLNKDLQLLQSPGFNQMFQRDMRRAAAKKLDYTIAFGKGGKSPKGICSTIGAKIYSAQSGKFGVLGTDALGGAQFQADWQGGALDFDGLEEMDLILEEDDITVDANQPIISSKRYFTWLKRLKTKNFDTQTDGFAYLLGVPMLSAQKLADYIGPYATSNQFKSNELAGASVGAPTTQAAGTGKCSTVIRGNLNDFCVGRWVGIEIEDDGGMGTGFVKEQMLVKLSLRIGTICRRPRSLVICPDAKVRA